jgi:hypothetical protein
VHHFALFRTISQSIDVTLARLLQKLATSARYFGSLLRLTTSARFLARFFAKSD